MSTRTLLVDNYDSFTYNLFTLLAEVNGEPPTVVHNDVEWDSIPWSDFDNIVISPGPGRPERQRDFGISARVITETALPVLGVCLGHQGLCQLFGGSVVLAPEPMHGRVSLVEHNGSELFAGIPSPFPTVRYHSLIVEDLPDDLEATAWTADGLLMGVRHRTRPLWGVQFHPESISTAFGHELLANFRDLTQTHSGTPTHGSMLRIPIPHAPYVVQQVRVDHEVDPRTTFEDLFASGPNAFWLDGTSASEPNSRFTIMGNCSGPRAEYITYDVSEAIVRITREGLPVEQVHAPFFDYLERQLQARSVPGLPGVPFGLGYVGYLGYELKAETGGTAAHKSPTPDAALVFADRAVVIDHSGERTYALCLSDHQDDPELRRWLDEMEVALHRLAEPDNPPTAVSPIRKPESAELALRHEHDKYLEHIATSLGEIRTGESYEVCLTNMATVDQSIDPLHTFELLRSISPTPYSAYLQFAGLSVLSASPERFLRIGADRVVESKPIKGTRPRGATPAKDAALRQDLLDSEKDRAENLMIVDLTRNDLARVCVPGSVHVPKLFDVETYAAVHQLVSTVRGTLSADASVVECVRAAFPGGSMTGAPKIRTMEIIDRLESGPRGVYSGSIGYFSLTGTADLSIVIRTIVATDTEVTFGIGGAITALSDPEEEFDEAMVKAATMLRALTVTADRPNEIGP
ncbi:aminodeoxychorismate synthase component I [Rhodococcus jostii]|jgi:para-aminobenzoate synthetase|uniref:aminodeoxychorismate synthase n=1 Tax=Rhodococcus jostii TaxID=132919 RepID=A0ABU4CHJ9_RHOJO|nr:aminodeoxychorismate synthase component I [Rhodococcus jostii]MDV6282743.1 aminodeoxychorismate synthase component I [Rhodococcus jostii]